MSTIEVPGYPALHEVTSPPVPAADYQAVMCADLTYHYESGLDALWWNEPALREGATALLRAMRGRTNQHVLDVGTARALDVPGFLAAGHRVTGIDVLPLRPECDSLAREHPGRVRFLRTALLDLTADQPFDAVLDNGCFHHQHPDSYVEYFRKLHELIRPGGWLSMLVFHADAEAGRLYANAGDRLYRTFTAGEVAALGSAAHLLPMESKIVRATVQEIRYVVMTFMKPELAEKKAKGPVAFEDIG